MKKQFSGDMVPRKMPKGKTPTVTTKRQQKVGSPAPVKVPTTRKALTWRLPSTGILVTVEH